MNRGNSRWAVAATVWLGAAALVTAADTVSTAIYARIGNGYQRERLADGTFKPEHYALANGGRIAGTASDHTIDRVTYPEVAEIAARLLAQQNYHYAQSKEQAKLLLVLNWGATLSFNSVNYGVAVQELGKKVAELAETKMYDQNPNADSDMDDVDVMTDQLLMLRMQNKIRDDINLPNAKILGYLDAINEADGIQRWAGGGDRYNDLIADIEEPRYYIVITAYDFPALVDGGKKKLLWQTRVSVRSPGNSFDDSFVPMLKSASAYFGRDSGRLVRGEEAKAVVELGDLQFLGEAANRPRPAEAGK
jgi:hypothetical protein